MRREVDINGVQVLKENKLLRDELEYFKNSKKNLTPDVRAENKNQILSELQKLKQENERLKE